MTPTFDIRTREFNQNPYPHFARMRRDEPVSYGSTYYGEAWVLTRYADVVDCLENTRRFVSDSRSLGDGKDPHEKWWMPKLMQAFRDNLVSTDDPQHKRLRNLVHKA